MQFDVTILGSNSAIAAYNRHPSSQVINYNGHLFMVDCGEGTQFRMNAFAIKRARLDNIFITHLHGDHYFGLIGLLTSFNLNWREHPLNIYGPAPLQEIMNIHFKHANTQLRFEINYHVVEADIPRVIYEDDHLSVETIILTHRLPTTGFLFKEKKNQRRILPEKIREYQVPHTEIKGIKCGYDYTTPDGVVIPNKELTADPGKPRSYAYCSDTVYTENYIEQLKGVDLLYHEATFVEEHAFRAAETYHCTTKQAARIAQLADVGKLLIGHYSARYDNLEILLEESRSVFANSFLATEGQVFNIG